MKLRNNLVLINILIITIGLALSTLMFLGTMSRLAERQAIQEQETAIRTFWQLLLDKGTDFRVVDGRLLVGNYVVNGNYELPDKVKEIFGGTATIFMGDTRVSTNVLKPDGSRAIGTRLTGPAYDALFKDQRPFRGEAPILGIPYFTAYDPIRDRHGNTIGVLYVGVKKNQFLTTYSRLKMNVIAGTVLLEILLVALAFGLLRERIRAEKSRREMAETTSLITDSIPAAIAYVDTQFRFRFANRRYAELFGSGDAGSFIGRDVREVLDKSVFAAREENIRQALAGNEIVFSSQLHRNDGSTLYLQTAYIPHKSENGVVTGYFIQHHDITSLTLTQEALRTSEEQYRTLFNTTGTASIVSEEDTTISLANEEFCRLTGYSADRIVGKLSWAGFVSPESRELLLGYHKTRRIDPDDPKIYECEVMTKDGSLRNIVAHVSLIPNSGRSVISFLDITPQKELEKNLHGQLTFLQTLIDTIPNPIFYKDRYGRYTGCNHAFEKCLGFARDDVVGKTVYDLAPPELAERYREMDEMLFTSQGVQIYDASVMYADGSPHDVTFYKATFQNTEGIVEGLVGVILDLSDRKRAEQWLAGEKSALEMIVRNAPLAEVMELLCKNVEAQSPKSLCSVLLLDETAHLRHSAAPSLPEAYVKAVDGTRIGPMIGSCGTAAYTNRLVVTADIATDPHWEKYRSLPLRHGLRASFSTPIRSSKGVILGTFAAYYPEPHEPDPAELQLVEQAAQLASIIIERDRNEAALRESEERFHQIFVQKDDAILLIRMDDLVIIDANPAALELFGYDYTGLMAMRPYQLIVKEDFDALLSAIPSNGPSEVFQIDRAEGVSQDGGRVTIAIRCKILLLRSEYIIHCSIRDITEKVRLEEEIRNAQAKLIHANKMSSIGMLASSVAHEINNPNNCISVNSAMMTDIWQDAEPLLSRHREEHGEFCLRGLPFAKMQEIVPRLLIGITEGSRRITGIVQNMRDYVREDKSGLHAAVDVNQLLQNAMSILWHHIHIHTDEFTTSLGEGLPPARGNAQQLEQVFINLIANALQALPVKKSGVTVSTRMDDPGEMIIITVRDEGRGMTEEVLANLTEPFFTTRADKGGTGLGLYISASIIKEHGGTLDFQSKPAMGTTATVRLPVAPPVA